MAEGNLENILKRHSALAVLDDILRISRDAFAGVDREPKTQLTFGFIAILAVSQLMRIPFAEAKRTRTALLQELDEHSIESVLRQSEATAHSRGVSEQFSAAIWGVISFALQARSIFLVFQAECVPDDKGMLYAKNVAQTLFEKIDSYIQKYAAAGIAELRAVGLESSARAVDPSTR